MLTVEQIMELMPHRYPMLLVDRIVSMEPGKRCRGLKNVTINEAFFQGHYPGRPIMPGVLIVEAIAQAGAVVLLCEEDNLGTIPLIGAIDDVRFKRPVVPGDQLISDVELLWFRHGVGRMRGVATVDGEIAASMELTFKLAPKDP